MWDNHNDEGGDDDNDDDGLDVSRADDGLDVMTGNHVLPELRALSWSINCYNCYTEQQPGHRHATKGCPGSWPVKTDIVLAFFFFLSFSLTQVKKDII